MIGPSLGEHRDEVTKLNEATFSKVTDDVRGTALIPQDRTLTAEDIQSTCQLAFEHIFEGQEGSRHR